MKRFVLLAFLFVLLCAHELFLKSDTYFLVEHTPSELYLFNGTFDESENVITRDRVVNTRIVGPEYQFLPKPSDYYDKEDATYLKFVTAKAGTYAAGVSTLPRVIELNAEDFRDYLEHEGLDGVIADRQAKGISDRPAREKYSKHVKALLQVSEKRTDHYSEEFGYPIEFMPLENPYELSVGDKLSFQLLVNGTPIAGQTVHFSSRKGDEETEVEENMTKTDEKGVFSIDLMRPGKWYVATIHMVGSDEATLDYESNWATMTFEIR